MTTEPVLSVENLCVDLASGRGRILRNIHFDVPAGAVVGLVGESGSGKSTLVSAVLGLLRRPARVASGRIVCDGADMTRPADAERARGRSLAYVGQHPMSALNPVLTVGRQLVDLQHARTDLTRRDKLDRAAEWMGRVGIAKARARLDAYPFELSGGMLQRIAVAAALMTEPRLLLADEPTTALDVTVEAQIVRLLAEARDAYGLSVVLVTHHLALAAGICERVAVLYGGCVVEEGPTAEVFRRPAHRYTAALVACDPVHAAASAGNRPLPTIPGSPPGPADVLEGCRFAPRCDHARDDCRRHSPPDTDAGARRHACFHPVTGPTAGGAFAQETPP